MIELNAYAHQSTRLADLSIEKKTDEVLCFVLNQVRPEVANCAGADAARAVKGLHVDWPMLIIEAKHFIYWGLEREAELAREINAALHRRSVPLSSTSRQTAAREPDDRAVKLTKSAPRALQLGVSAKMVDPIETLRHRAAGTRFSTVGGRGGQFTVRVRDAGRVVGVEFIRSDGSSKPVSAERFMKFWRLWTSGVRDLADYRNETGQQTRAASAVCCLPVFEWLSRQPG